jgi:hypothetical protein
MTHKKLPTTVTLYWKLYKNTGYNDKYKFQNKNKVVYIYYFFLNVKK